ncbi:MAG TPA: CDP-alcohol phosphatidyltransferase family protein [Thermoguttaceae bacterium]|nr:CDP-alcohol phosphatidyltransferase family protein [Thermoguttaceae bacterium]
MTEQMARRPIRSRDTAWAHCVAATLARWGVRPNWISWSSVVASAGAGASLAAAGRADGTVGVVFFYVLAAALMQTRLLCNLLDGMVAIEGGMRSRSGEIFNDLPDRLADPLIFVGAGYSMAGHVPHGVALGYVAAMGSLLVAYIRVLGVSAGASQCYLGPMAKPHRMALLTAAAIGSAVEWFFWQRGVVMAGALGLAVAGEAVTTVRRVVHIVRELESA